jgi:hypothetical protein
VLQDQFLVDCRPRGSLQATSHDLLHNRRVYHQLSEDE